MRSRSLRYLFILLAAVALCMSIFPSLTFASAAIGSSELTPAQQVKMHSMNNLEVAYQQWHVYRPTGGPALGFANGSMLPVKAPVNNLPAIQMAINSQRNYYNLHVYRDLPAQNNARYFRMTVSFYLTHVHPAQALEFHMNKWVGNTRWKFAMQWQATPDGSKQQGSSNSWRVWAGTKGWQKTSIVQDLSINKWHTLHLTGEVVNGKVHYLAFDCDSTKIDLHQLQFAPVQANKGYKLAVAVQLDGAPYLAPSPLDVAGINLQWL